MVSCNHLLFKTLIHAEYRIFSLAFYGNEE